MQFWHGPNTLLLTYFCCCHHAARLFPHQEVYKWLAYGNGALSFVTEPAVQCVAAKAARRAVADGKHPMVDASFFQHREFCFTLDGDIFVRYQSFKVATFRYCLFACSMLLPAWHGTTENVQAWAILSGAAYFVQREGHQLAAACIVQDGLELAAALKDRCPSKIDIGPVYNVEPQRRAAYQGGLARAPLQHWAVAPVLAMQLPVCCATLACLRM